ncbi:MAG: type IV secretion system DNA-binding domain-containing protein [Candidatus Pacebacteria bacterium]|nr:type IV secretion system DNA-binding domain-containing protein [Candidatus Paceibacterota bacterium]
MHDENKIVYFAATDSRGKRQPFGIKMKDRSRHVYVIGKTGMGKSTLLENMAIQDIQNGQGLAFLDPHGKTAELLLDYVPKSRVQDVIYFAPFDTDYPISFNVMEDVGPDKRHLVANGLMSAFKKIWVDAWSARMEYILNNTLLALLEYPNSTIIGVNRMLADKDYRNKVVENITDPSVKAFWTDEFARYGDRYMQEAGAAIQNKVGQFVANPLVRNIIGQPKSTIDTRQIMDEKKIIIINLSKGRVGEANANLLGSMLITKIYLGAMSRADVSNSEMQKLPPFYLYVDEFQSFANESFADILSEARKYKLSLTLAHQYIEQMSEEVRAAVFGNIGTMAMFRVGAYDAEVLEKEFAPTFIAEDMVNLGFIQIYLKLMIDGVTSPPFSATTLAPIELPKESLKEQIIDFSRKRYAQPRANVEEYIRKWHEPIVPKKESQDKKPFHKNPHREFTPKPSTKNSFSQITFNEKGGMVTPSPVKEKTSKPFSLSTLSSSEKYKQRQIEKEKKTATPESFASLKSVLSEVLDKNENKKDFSPEQVKKEPTAQPVSSKATQESSREVSEERLKEIFKADA